VAESASVHQVTSCKETLSCPDSASPCVSGRRANGRGNLRPHRVWLTYRHCRIDIGPGSVCRLDSETGRDLKNSDEVAPDDLYQGVQQKVLTTGRYFYNPYDYDWEIKSLIEIKTGKLGVRVSLTGDDLPYGEFLAQDGFGRRSPNQGDRPPTF